LFPTDALSAFAIAKSAMTAAVVDTVVRLSDADPAIHSMKRAAFAVNLPRLSVAHCAKSRLWMTWFACLSTALAIGFIVLLPNERCN
jgi:hypothetical protein